MSLHRYVQGMDCVAAAALMPGNTMTGPLGAEAEEATFWCLQRDANPQSPARLRQETDSSHAAAGGS